MVKDAQVGVLRRKRMEGNDAGGVGGSIWNERAERAQVGARIASVASA